jgi:hypothetical protein
VNIAEFHSDTVVAAAVIVYTRRPLLARVQRHCIAHTLQYTAVSAVNIHIDTQYSSSTATATVTVTAVQVQCQFPHYRERQSHHHRTVQVQQLEVLLQVRHC